MRRTSGAPTLAPADLARLLARAGVTPRPFQARQSIDIGAGQLAIVLQGAVSISVELDDGYAIEAALAGSGDWIGWPPTTLRAQYLGALNGELGLVPLNAVLAQAAALGWASSEILALSAPTTQRAWINLACQGRHSIVQRLARRILQLSRLSGGSSTLHMTQDDAALALGVQRTSVTHAAIRLQEAHAIKVVRARTIITDRAALQRLACSCSAQNAPGERAL